MYSDLHPDSSALNALLDLTPFESPISSSFSCSGSYDSGDISILLHDILIDPGVPDDDRLSVRTSVLHGSPSARSLGTIESAGTFGPKRLTSNLSDTWSHRSFILSSSPDPQEPTKASVPDPLDAISFVLSRDSQPTLSIYPTSTTLSIPVDTLPSPTFSICSVSASAITSSSGGSSRDTLHPFSSTIGTSNSISRIEALEEPTEDTTRFHRSHLSLPRPHQRDAVSQFDTVVELLIDQEGFRSVSPKFRYAGFSTKKDPGGTVFFIPLERYIYNFHYAPFEGVPILRRVTLNGDESRDYISRQANLIIKNNGVYSVCGMEDVSPRIGSDLPKIRWTFDYVVDDRKAGTTASRTAMEGEKTLIPLTFSCSPCMLDPRQGKKIKLMHILKKTMIAKLVAEKQNPPVFANLNNPNPLDQRSLLPGLSGPSMQASTVQYVKSHVWNLHRRAHSQIISPGVSHPDSLLERPQVAKDRAAGRGPTGNLPGASRRRRASSAGEGGRRILRSEISAPIDRCEALETKGTSVLDRHILPPEQLTELMSNIALSLPSRRARPTSF